ncbi:hypothetical protein ACWJJH_02860 [Endozoicomonadaceae bacterium StTr2]
MPIPGLDLDHEELLSHRHCEDLHEICTLIRDYYPPGAFAWCGLGRSPSCVMAALECLNPGIQTLSIPLSDVGDGFRFNNPEQYPDSAERIERVFDSYLGHRLPAQPNLLLIDYVMSADSLFYAGKWLGSYLRTRYRQVFMLGLTLESNTRSLVHVPMAVPRLAVIACKHESGSLVGQMYRKELGFASRVGGYSMVETEEPDARRLPWQLRWQAYKVVIGMKLEQVPPSKDKRHGFITKFNENGTVGVVA